MKTIKKTLHVIWQEYGWDEEPVVMLYETDLSRNMHDCIYAGTVTIELAAPPTKDAFDKIRIEAYKKAIEEHQRMIEHTQQDIDDLLCIDRKGGSESNARTTKGH